MAKTILLADDSITIQKIVNLTFSGEGIEVVTVANGDAAIKKVHEIRPNLVLADIFMPGKNGYEVCEYLKAEPSLSGIPVILLVGAFEPFDTNEAERVKADGHLTKPFEIKVLISAVNSLISTQEPAVEEPVAGEKPAEEPLGVEVALPEAVALEPAFQVEPPTSDVDAGSEAGIEAEEWSTPAEVAPSLPLGVSPDEPELGLGEPSQEPEQLDQPPSAQPAELSERPRSVAPQIDLEELDPLGLYSSDLLPDYSEGEAQTSSEAPALVVDIWESRSGTAEVNEAVVELESEALPAERASAAEVEQQLEPAAEAVSEGVDQAVAPESPVPAASLATESDSAIVDSEKRTPIASLGEIDEDALAERVAKKVVERLSREAVERIVWEVVPDLAEALIKEHLKTQMSSELKR
ncbi:MAG: response regulator [Acidobacteriota bacterium]